MRAKLAGHELPGSVLTLLCSIIAACSPATDSGRRFVARDSAGVTIVQSSAPQWSPGAEWRIGDIVTELEQLELSGVIGGVRLNDGTMVAAEEGGSRLLLFRSDGTLMRSVGRGGDGPGEFRLLQAIGRAGDDTVWVYDFSLARLSRFDAGGELLDIVRLTPPLPSALAIGNLPDASLILTSQWRTGRARNAVGLMRDTVAVLRYVAGTLTDTVGTVAGREFVQYAEPGGRMVMAAAILPRRTSATVWRELVVLGDQIDHELRVVGADGVLRQLIRWSGPDLSLTSADVAAWVTDRIKAAHPGQREGLQALYANGPVPTRRPSYGQLLADATGHLWVAEYPVTGEEAIRWDVFDTDGVWLGAVRAPDRFRPLDIGSEWILGVGRDSLDAERLELRSLRR